MSATVRCFGFGQCAKPKAREKKITKITYYFFSQLISSESEQMQIDG